MTVEFVKQLPLAIDIAAQRELHSMVAKALKRRPGQWAKVPLPSTSMTAINRMGLVAFRDNAGTFEAISRNGNLYVRFNKG